MLKTDIPYALGQFLLLSLLGALMLGLGGETYSVGRIEIVLGGLMGLSLTFVAVLGIGCGGTMVPLTAFSVNERILFPLAYWPAWAFCRVMRLPPPALHE